MRVEKEAGLGAAEALDENDLGLINVLSRRKLGGEEVYPFCVRLCDNEVDRDGERFATQTLEELAPLFVGKSGVFDHQWSTHGQTARIYRTELVREDQIRTSAGDPYCYLKGYAYMLRTEKNRDLIDEIEGGIKKEVSVGCAVERAVCSICGESGPCVHVKGARYDGTLCYRELTGATDAYEWSFVAVPAQKNAGVLKRFGPGGDGQALKAALLDRPDLLEQLERVEEEARAGRRYLAALRTEVSRLGGLAEPGLDCTVRNGIVEKLAEQELLSLKKAYEDRLDERYPVGTQLTYDARQENGESRDGAFLI